MFTTKFLNLQIFDGMYTLKWKIIKFAKKAILKFNISLRHNINDFLMYNVLFVQKSSVYNASLTNFRAKKIRELATKIFFYFLFFFLSICPTYGENLKRIWDYSNSICYFDKELLIYNSYVQSNLTVTIFSSYCFLNILTAWSIGASFSECHGWSARSCTKPFSSIER